MSEERAQIKEDYWREIVTRYESSGVSQKEFSRIEGVSKSRLSYWVRKFRADCLSGPKFLELPSAETPSVCTSEAEIHFPSGIVLKLRG